VSSVADGALMDADVARQLVADELQFTVDEEVDVDGW
jgi:hypothetical protein